MVKLYLDLSQVDCIRDIYTRGDRQEPRMSMYITIEPLKPFLVCEDDGVGLANDWEEDEDE
jgi:hypothetical protein